MSSGLVDIYDEHRDYLALCEELGEHPVHVLPLGGYEQWSKHWEQLKRRASSAARNDVQTKETK